MADIHAVLPAVRGFFSAALDGEADVDTALRLAYWLHRFWVAVALDEGRSWLERLLDASPPDAPSRGPAEFALGFLLLWSGHPDCRQPTTSSRRPSSSIPRTGCSPPPTTTSPTPPRTADLISPGAITRRPSLPHPRPGSTTSPCAAGSVWLSSSSRQASESAGLQRYEEALQALEPTVDADAYIVALSPYVTMLISVGRLDDAHRVLQRIERSVGDEVRITAMVAAASRARLEWHRDRHDVARRHAERAQAMIEQVGVGRLDGLVSPTLALAALAAGDADAAVGELARGLKAAIAAEQFAIVADILDAATIVAAALGRGDRAVEIHAAAEQLRRRSQVRRGTMEQAELDGALGDSRRHRRTAAEPDVELARVVDLIGGMASD